MSAPILADAVFCALNGTPGTGPFTLGTALLSYLGTPALTDGVSYQYTAYDSDSIGTPNGGREWGFGTYTAAGTSFSRDTVLGNSTYGTGKMNLQAGARFFIDPKAEFLNGLGSTSPAGPAGAIQLRSPFGGDSFFGTSALSSDSLGNLTGLNIVAVAALFGATLNVNGDAALAAGKITTDTSGNIVAAGTLALGTSTVTTGSLTLLHSGDLHSTVLKAPNTSTGNLTWTLPAALPQVSNPMLVGTDSTGALSALPVLNTGNVSMTLSNGSFTLNTSTISIFGLGVDTTAFANGDLFIVGRASDSTTQARTYAELKSSIGACIGYHPYPIRRRRASRFDTFTFTNPNGGQAKHRHVQINASSSSRQSWRRNNRRSRSTQRQVKWPSSRRCPRTAERTSRMARATRRLAAVCLLPAGNFLWTAAEMRQRRP